MSLNKTYSSFSISLVVMISTACLCLTGCGRSETKTSKPEKVVIATSGSDTMVNLAQMWAEEYQKVNPAVTVEVAGGGSGVGIRDLIQGVITIANTSREMESAEREQAKQKTGKDPVEFVVAYDALA